jgi:hypothetical protein
MKLVTKNEEKCVITLQIKSLFLILRFENPKQNNIQNEDSEDVYALVRLTIGRRALETSRQIFK